MGTPPMSLAPVVTVNGERGIRRQVRRGRESGHLADHVIGHGASHTFNEKCAGIDGERVHLLIKSDHDLLVQRHASGARRNIDGDNVRGRSVCGCAGGKGEVEGRGKWSSAYVPGRDGNTRVVRSIGGEVRREI